MIVLVLVERGGTLTPHVCDSRHGTSDYRRAPATLVRVLCEGKASLHAGNSQSSSNFVSWCKIAAAMRACAGLRKGRVRTVTGSVGMELLTQ